MSSDPGIEFPISKEEASRDNRIVSGVEFNPEIVVTENVDITVGKASTGGELRSSKTELDDGTVLLTYSLVVNVTYHPDTHAAGGLLMEAALIGENDHVTDIWLLFENAFQDHLNGLVSSGNEFYVHSFSRKADSFFLSRWAKSEAFWDGRGWHDVDNSGFINGRPHQNAVEKHRKNFY